MININIAIFASGSGTNTQNIIKYLMEKRYLSEVTPCLSDHYSNKKDKLISLPSIDVKLVLSNKKDAFVLERAKNLNVKTAVFTTKELRESNFVDNLLLENNIHFIILAGFLVKFPDRLVKKYEGRIINLHPSLLPKYGGKGMYGSMVHQAIIDAKESESGITVHLVDEQYDNGQHLFQAKCTVLSQETPESLAKTIHQLEWKHFPRVICEYIFNYYLNGK
ncbi:MAG: phosphoribosylglycinamide formyltransferase, partial [Bacteroidales bacterium]